MTTYLTESTEGKKVYVGLLFEEIQSIIVRTAWQKHCVVDHIVSLVNRLPLSFFYWAWNPDPWWSATHIQNESLFLSLATLEILTLFLSCVSEVTLNLVKLTKKINYHKQWHYPHWVCFVILRPAFHEIADSLVGHKAGFCPNRFHYFPLHIRMMEQSAR